MSHLESIQQWLRKSDLAGLLIPSTDEFLSEFAPPAKRRLKWATGFGGSTGLGVVLRDKAALFLDGRYALQGRVETAGTGITVVAATLSARRDWLQRHVPSNARLGLDPRLHSIPDVEQWRSLAAQVGFELAMRQDNPIDRLWGEDRAAELRPPIVDYPVRYAGEPSEVKCAALIEHLKDTGLQALLVPDAEDVSWLLNVRAADTVLNTAVDEWHIVPCCTSRVLVQRNGQITWFAEADQLTPGVRAQRERFVHIAPPESLAAALREAGAQGPIGADVRRTPEALAALLEGKASFVADDTVARRRWRKHPLEVAGAKRAHVIDATAVVRFMAWLTQTVPQCPVTEFEAAQKLAVLRAEHPECKGLSMPLMSASGISAAQPHYIPHREGCRRLNDHPIYWMDSGGQYLGGTTDNTFALALGTPEGKHILAHTLVLKGQIALAQARFPRNAYALNLDTLARQALWKEGMDYGHGTGHGVSNHLNVHEGPLMSREPMPLSTVPLEPGMILSNEPAYYAEGDFGVRLESHLVVVESSCPNFLEFETISRLPIDPRLVDFSRLSAAERRWLADYHRAVWIDLEPHLDRESVDWLRALVQAFDL